MHSSLQDCSPPTLNRGHIEMAMNSLRKSCRHNNLLQALRADIYLLAQLQLGVMQPLQDELVAPLCWVGVAFQHKGCHKQGQSLASSHSPSDVQSRVLVPP